MKRIHSIVFIFQTNQASEAINSNTLPFQLEELDLNLPKTSTETEVVDEFKTESQADLELEVQKELETVEVLTP